MPRVAPTWLIVNGSKPQKAWLMNTGVVRVRELMKIISEKHEPPLNFSQLTSLMRSRGHFVWQFCVANDCRILEANGLLLLELDGRSTIIKPKIKKFTVYSEEEKTVLEADTLG